MHTEITDSIGFTVACDHFVLMLGINYLCNRVSLFSGMERWNGMVEWNGGME